jgi:hypothetical protein
MAAKTLDQSGVIYRCGVVEMELFLQRNAMVKQLQERWMRINVEADICSFL